MSSIKTITLATIYENQGLKEDALKIYQDILNLQPDNQEARLGVIRLSQTNAISQKADAQWLHIFNQIHIPVQHQKFQQWLLQWN